MSRKIYVTVSFVRTGNVRASRRASQIRRQVWKTTILRDVRTEVRRAVIVELPKRAQDYSEQEDFCRHSVSGDW